MDTFILLIFFNKYYLTLKQIIDWTFSMTTQKYSNNWTTNNTTVVTVPIRNWGKNVIAKKMNELTLKKKKNFNKKNLYYS